MLHRVQRKLGGLPDSDGSDPDWRHWFFRLE